MKGTTVQRRFIAGAVCPRCGVMDRTVIDLASERRECIACGFGEERPQAGAAPEPPTRVSRAAARRVETAAEPVRLLEPRPPRSRDG